MVFFFVNVHNAGGYNKYVELIGGTIGVGACGAGNKIQGFKDHTKLVHFLSGMF